jgi:hypothetical protein|eukprot:COSAG06_NODE_5872_length_3234_cov_3.348006_2_plen_76_part_00
MSSWWLRRPRHAIAAGCACGCRTDTWPTKVRVPCQQAKQAGAITRMMRIVLLCGKLRTDQCLYSAVRRPLRINMV